MEPPTVEDWQRWLHRWHADSAGVWMVFAKRARRYGARPTPRHSINRDRAQRLIADGLMQPAGLAAVEQAQSNGRWEAAYDGRAAAVPPDVQAALDAAPPASDLFARLDSRNRYAILPVGRVRGGRPPLRVRRRWRSGRRALTGLSGCR